MRFNRRFTDETDDRSLIERGFTLIELLVVIAILGVLAVVGILAFGGLTDTAKKSTAQTELTEVQTAADAYNAIHNAYPADPGTTNCTLGAAGPSFVCALETDTSPELHVTAAEAAKNATVVGGLQCNYTLTNGEVAFAATQVDPNCA